MVDNRNGQYNLGEPETISFLCNRRFGIGADGLIYIKNHTEYDFEMVYFNADGTQSLCGNGSRCAVKYAKALGIINNTTEFLAIDGPHHAYIQEDLVHLKMGNVASIEQWGNNAFVDTGSPHHICWTDNAKEENVVEKGRTIRYGEPYGQVGTNVNFVEANTLTNTLYIRTYERGVEDETLSCGTGVTASSLAATAKGLVSPVKVQTPGGQLEVSFTQRANGSFTDIYLIGPANKVFEGTLDY